MVTAITVSSNGNSPEVKMLGGMMVDVHKGFVPMAKQETTTNVVTTNKSNYDKSKTLANSTKLSANERYRRLIPYMTFYYANDIPTTEAYSSKNIEVEKVELVEAKTIQSNHRQPHKIVYAPQRNIPRYQGNRLTHFNIASANPTKVYYKNDVPVYQSAVKITPNYNPLVRDGLSNRDHLRFVQKQVIKAPSAPFTTTRKPYLNLYSNEDGNFQYYLAEKNYVPKFKLVPYEQTPVKLVPQSEVYEPTKPLPVPVLIPKEPVFIKTKPARPQYVYDNVNVQQIVPKKQPVVVSESYYEKRRPASAFVQPIAQPIVESGFKPIVNPVITTESTIYTTLPNPIPQFVSEKPNVQIVEPMAPERNFRPNYYQYVVEQPLYKTKHVEPVPAKATVNLGDLLNSLQLNKSIPKPITQENVGSSIRTLLQVLNALKAMSSQNDVEPPLLSTPKPFIAPEEVVEMSPKPVIEVTPAPVLSSPIPYADLQNEPHLAQVNTPSQHLDGKLKNQLNTKYKHVIVL